MNDMAPGAYGTLIEPATLKIERLLPGTIDRVWAYLTDSDLRAKWLAAGPMVLRPGAPFTFVWRHDGLSDAPPERPAGVPDEMRMESRIVESDPPHRLVFTWQGTGDVTFDLAPAGDGVLLTVTHRRVDDRASLMNTAPGWHAHLDILAARLAGAAPGPFWPAWTRLKADYEQRLAA